MPRRPRPASRYLALAAVFMTSAAGVVVSTVLHLSSGIVIGFAIVAIVAVLDL